MAALALQERLSTVRRLDGLRIGVVDYAPGREVTAVQYHYQRSFVEDIRYGSEATKVRKVAQGVMIVEISRRYVSLYFSIFCTFGADVVDPRIL